MSRHLDTSYKRLFKALKRYLQFVGKTRRVFDCLFVHHLRRYNPKMKEVLLFITQWVSLKLFSKL